MYSVEQRKNITWSCDAINADQAYCKTLRYSDYKNHANINLLPSYHPYWKFSYYLRTKAIFINKIKIIRQYKNILSNDLEKSIHAQIEFQIEQLKASLTIFDYRDLCSKLIS